MLSSLLCTAALLLPQEPLRIGIIADATAGGADQVFLRGAQYAVDAVNKDGGVDGSKFELRIVAGTTPAQVVAAVGTLQQEGAVAVVAPQAAWLGEAARKASAGKLPCVSFAIAPVDCVPLVERVVRQNFCMARIGLVRDGSRPAVDLGKRLAKGGLTAPVTLVWELDITSSPKVVQKQMEKERPELLLFDAEPPAVAKFLGEVLAVDAIPVVLLPRCYDDSLRALSRRLFVVMGLSMTSVALTSPFRGDYERDHGRPGKGAAEGYEGIMAVAMAARAAKSRDPQAIATCLEAVTLEGVRGRYSFDKTLGAFAAPFGIWVVEGGLPSPYVPGVVPLQAVGASAGTDTAPVRLPQATIGEPFGTWRTRQFEMEEGAQWVVCDWATDTGFTSIDSDLKQLGLSTGGVDPLVDHLVKEEIMARVIAVTSTKFGRSDDGKGIEGKSLRISFGMHVSSKEREKKKQRVWPALFGGDHTGAGGEAFGTYCRVYSSFIRRTIFQPNALVPPVTAADRQYLDGTYVFSTDYPTDKRSELIRALINGYAGSMALTLAHEVGHLAGLDHVIDDPAEIMNVNEGAGIDYRDAHFGPGTWEIMRNRYGLTGDKPGKKR